jgi:hypothetical protein
MTPHDNQVVRTLIEPVWGFDADGPAYSIHHGGSYSRHDKVDAAPCYAHDEALAREEFERVRQLAPLPFPIAVFLLSHECSGRTNGHYLNEWNYTATPTATKTGEQYPAVGIIVLSGKRIPIHPAMTRYLVAHEYGHGVMYHLTRQRGLKSEETLLAAYVQKSRPDASRSYGCRRWHANAGELFANDFRLLVAMRELEFWPHPGFARPERSPEVVAFWKDAEAELLAEPTEAAA